MTRQDFEQYSSKLMKGQVAETWDYQFNLILDDYSDINKLKFLDFGCGDGRYFPYLLTKGLEEKNIYGVEVSKIRIEKCQLLGFKNATYIELNSKLPFENDFFDIVNLVEVIEHIPKEKISFYLDDIVRVLKPGGYLILTTPNYPIKRFYDFYDAFRNGFWERLKDDPTHVSFYNHKKLRKLLTIFFPENNVEFLPYKEGIIFKRFRRNLFLHKMLVVCRKD